jgi:hypothetical protein
VDGSDDGGVGYKHPPRHTRFRKGQSGNPRGRPKGTGVRSAAERVLDRLVTATVDGERRRVPLTEALVLQLAQKALGGDHRASREILRIADQVEAARPKTEDDKTMVIVRWAVDPQDCNPALRKLGAIVEVDGRYKIAPWVVEAGMARKPKLEASDDILIKNSTLRPGDKPSEKLITREELAEHKAALKQGGAPFDPARPR